MGLTQNMSVCIMCIRHMCLHVLCMLAKEKKSKFQKKTSFDFGYNSAMEILEVSSMHGGG